MPLIVCPDCQHDISDAAPACIYCGRPNIPRATATAPILDSAPLDPSEPTADSVSSGLRDEGFFAPIAIHKLIIMSYFTLGLYEIHWFYKQWDYIRRADRKRFNPALRAILNGLFAYPLFRSIKLRGLARRAEITWSPGVLTIAWFSLGVIVATTNLRVLFGLATTLPLIVVQRSINGLNEPSRMDRRYSAINVAGIVAGMVVFFLVGFGTYILATGTPTPAR
jgi:hypothetical protein